MSAPSSPITNPDKTVTFNYLVPTGVAAPSLAILGFSDVSLADRSSVTNPTGGYARVANSGSGTLQLGVTTQTGPLLSAGNVFLQESAHVHGDLTVTGSLSTQSKYYVDGSTKTSAVLTRRVNRSHSFKYTTGDRNISLEPGQTRSTPLAPAMYDSLTVKQNAKVVLLAGDYYFQRIQIEPGGTLIFNNSEGTTNLYVGDTFDFKGKMAAVISGGTIKLFTTFLGAGQAFISGPYRGTLVAPNGTIDLEKPGTDHHEGTFWGRTVRVAPDTVIVHKALSSIITNVTFSKSQVCPGESVTTNVTAVDPSGGATAPVVTINGVEGTRFTEQFFGAVGPRKVAVTARAADGTIESTIAQLNVVSCPASSPVPLLIAEPDLFHPGEVTLQIANADKFDDGTAHYQWSFGDGTAATTTVPTVNHNFVPAIATDALNGHFDVTVTVTRSGLADANGTRTFNIWNDYALSRRRGSIEPPIEAVSPVLSIQGATASADVKFKNLEASALTYDQRRVDTIPCDGDAAPTLGSVEAVSITVPAKGSVQQAIQFASSKLTASSCGATIHFWGTTAGGVKAQASVFAERPAQKSSAVPAGAHLDAMLNYLVQKNLVSNARTISEEEIARLYRERKIRYSATSQSFYQTSSNPDPVSNDQCDPDNPGTAPTGGSYSCQPTGEWTVDSPGWVAGAHIVNALKGDSVFVRSCGGHVRYIVGALQPSQLYTHTGMITKNYVEIRQSTGEDAYLMNHANGIADQPSDGFDERALRYLWPGTITSSIDEAFGAGRALTDPDGKSHNVTGFAPNQVRCTGDANVVYPRVAKPAPENESLVRARLNQAADLSKNIGGHYRFYQYSNAQDTPTNDPNGPQSTAQEGTGSGLGAGNPIYGATPTVCSSFVRFALQAAGADLDKDKSLPMVSDVTNNPPDGIFYYTPDERLAAGNALYTSLYNDVQYQLDLLTNATSDYVWVGALATVGLGLVFGPAGAAVGIIGTVGLAESGTFVKWATDAPDDVGNQVTNCFSSDNCSEDAKDSTAWQDPGGGFGVSPDNILDHFDAPSSKSPNGVYGYHEQMKYRGKRYSQVFRWLPATGTRSVCGTVFKDGAPALDAQVEIQGVAGASKVVGADGKFCFDAIPGGNIAVHAWKTYTNGTDQQQWDGKSCFVPDSSSATQWLTANCSDFAVTGSTPVGANDVTLLGPDSQYRKVIVEASVSVRDADCYTSDDWGGPYTYYRTCTVGPHDGEKVAALQTMGQNDLCADEAGVKISGSCTMLDSGKVKVDIDARLYEAGGGTCGADDQADSESVSITAPPNGKPTTYGDVYLSHAEYCYGIVTVWQIDDEGTIYSLRATNVIAD